MALKTTQLCVCELDNAAHKPFPPLQTVQKKTLKIYEAFNDQLFRLKNWVSM